MNTDLNEALEEVHRHIEALQQATQVSNLVTVKEKSSLMGQALEARRRILDLIIAKGTREAARS